jgi:hypothetical protein
MRGLSIIRSGDVVSFKHDRCAANNKAAEVVLKNYVGSLDQGCLSHTLTHPGEHFLVPGLLQCKRDVCALYKESFKAHNCGVHL